MESGSVRDQVFISYAVEDHVFTDWLAVKLAAAGYSVWYDRIKLLGGESFVAEVDDAIKLKARHVIAVLSQNSIKKSKPMGERQTALNVEKETGLNDILIPLNLDGLTATDLTWTIVDKSYIPFKEGWHDGLKKLLKKLESTNVPKNEKLGQELIRQFLQAKENAPLKEERIITNIIPATSMPNKIREIQIEKQSCFEASRDWAWVVSATGKVWAFVKPPLDKSKWKELRVLPWPPNDNPDDPIRKAGVQLLNKTMGRHLSNRGLIWLKEKNQSYFPDKLLEKDKIVYQGIDGKKTRLLVIGVRKQKKVHLLLGLRFTHWDYGVPAVKLTLGFYFQNPDGSYLDDGKQQRRQKSVRKSMHNDEWLRKHLAVIAWLKGENSDIGLFDDGENRFVLQGRFLELKANHGIDEEELFASRTHSETAAEELISNIDNIADDDDEDDESEVVVNE